MNSKTGYLRNSKQDSQSSVNRRLSSHQRTLDRAFKPEEQRSREGHIKIMASEANDDNRAEDEDMPLADARNASSFLQGALGIGLQAGHNLTFGAEPEEAEGAATRRRALMERWVAPNAALLSVKEDDEEAAVLVRVVNLVRVRETGIWELAYKRMNGPQAVKRVTVEEAEKTKGAVDSAILGFFGGDIKLGLTYVRVVGTAPPDNDKAMVSVDTLVCGEVVGDAATMDARALIDEAVWMTPERWPIGDELKGIASESGSRREDDDEGRGEEEEQDERSGGAGGGGERYGGDTVMELDEFPILTRAFEMLGITGGAGRSDRSTLGEMRTVVRELDDSAVDVESPTEVRIELAAAEAYLADGRGSPTMKALESLVRVGTLHATPLHTRAKIVRRLVLRPSSQTRKEPLQKERAKRGRGEEPLQPVKKPRGSRKRSRDKDSDDSDSYDSDEDSDASDGESGERRRSSKKRKTGSSEKQPKGEMNELVWRAGMDPLEVAAIVFDGGKACELAEVAPYADAAGCSADRRRARYSKAFARLCERVGTEWIGKKAPHSSGEVEDRVECMLDDVIRRERGRDGGRALADGRRDDTLGAGGSRGRSGGGHGSYGKSFSDDEEDKVSRAAKALSEWKTSAEQCRRTSPSGSSTSSTCWKGSSTSTKATRPRSSPTRQSVCGMTYVEWAIRTGWCPVKVSG